MSAVPERIRLEVKVFLEDKAEKATAGLVKSVSVEVRERIRTHAGPPALVKEALPEDPAPVPLPPGSWLAAGKSRRPRAKPEPGSRMRKGLDGWGIERLGPLPYHTARVHTV